MSMPGVARQYTSTLFSTAAWHQNARIIEIQTRQQLKYNLFHETQRIFVNKFYIWTPNGQRTSSVHRFFKVMCLCCIFELASAIFVWASIAKFCDLLTWRTSTKDENVEEMVGTTWEAVAATTGDETAATAGDEMEAMSELVDLLVTPQPFAYRGGTTTLSSQSLAPIVKVTDWNGIVLSIPTPHWQAAQRVLVIDPVTNTANVRRLCASNLVSNGFTRWPCTRQNAQMLSTVCRKYRLDPEFKKHDQQQNATEGTRHLVLEILPPTP